MPRKPKPQLKAQAAMEVLVIVGIMIIGIITFGSLFRNTVYNTAEMSVTVGDTKKIDSESLDSRTIITNSTSGGGSGSGGSSGGSHSGGGGGSGGGTTDTNDTVELDCSTCSCTDSECNLNCSKCNTAGDLCSTITNSSLCTNESHCACEAVCIQNTTFWNTYCAAPTCIVDGECDTDNGETSENCPDCITDTLEILSPILPGNTPFEYYGTHIPMYNLAKVKAAQGNDLTNDFNLTWAADWPDHDVLYNDENFDGLMIVSNPDNWNSGSMPEGEYNLYVKATKGVETIITSVPINSPSPDETFFGVSSEGEYITSPVLNSSFSSLENISFLAPLHTNFSSFDLHSVNCKWYYYNITENKDASFNSEDTNCTGFDFPAADIGMGEVLIFVRGTGTTKQQVDIEDTRMTKIEITAGK